jgi:hypothetical protein
MLLASVSALVIAGAVICGHVGLGKTVLQFSDDPKKPEISFTEVQNSVDPYVDSLINRSERDFQIKYSPEDRKRIHTRVWDRVRLVFSDVYNNEDKK